MANHFSSRGRVKNTFKSSPAKKLGIHSLVVSEAFATITDRPDFNADDILLGSGRRTISISAQAAEFGSYEYRVINFILDLSIQSGSYTFTKGEPGLILGMSYVEFAVIGGNEIYHNCEGLTGSLNLSIVGSTFNIADFSFSALDSEQKEITLKGRVNVSSTLCTCS